MSLVSAGCLVWLEAMKPLSALTAVAALAWQMWLVLGRPTIRTSRSTWAIVAATVAVNLFVAISWLALQWRYR